MTTLAMLLDLSDAFVSWRLDDDDAERVILALHESPVHGGPLNRCGGRRTTRIQYGMPADPEAWGPWLHIGGCCPRDETWWCDVCDHAW